MSDLEAKAREIAIDCEGDGERGAKLASRILDVLCSVRSDALEEAAEAVKREQAEVEVPRSYEMAHVCIGLDMAVTAIRDLKGE